MTTSPKAITPGPTPAQYVALHKHDLPTLREIRETYRSNITADPRPGQAEAWQRLLELYDAALAEAGIDLDRVPS